MKSRLWFCVKTIIAFGLLYYLYSQGHLTLDSFNVFFNYPTASAIVALIFIFNLLLASLRWKHLLSALNVNISYKTLVDINIIGAFGSVFLLGSAGGDALRAYYVARQMPNIKTKVLLSLIADRLLGLIALLILTAGASLLYFVKLDSSGESHKFVEIIFMLLSLCAVGGIATLFFINRFDVRKKLAVYQENSRIIRIVIQLLDGVLIFKDNIGTICACFAYSLIMQLANLWGFAVLGQAMGIGDLSSLEYMTASSFALLANSIPLTPGGIGIGEGAFNYFCQLLSSDPETGGYSSIFFSYRIIISLLSAIGLWRFIVYKNKSAIDRPVTL